MPMTPIGYVPSEKEILEGLVPKFTSFETLLNDCCQMQCNEETFKKYEHLIKDKFKISTEDIKQPDGDHKTVYSLLKHTDEDIGDSQRRGLEFTTGTITN